MHGEAYIIIVLAILVFILSILLTTRIRKERQRQISVRELDLSSCRDILRDSDNEAHVGSVINQTTSFLTNSFDCDRVLFFQRKKNLLRLDYQSSLNRLIPSASVVQLDDSLISILGESFSPHVLSELISHLPASLTSYLEKENCRLVLPVMWRDSLYGMFIVGRSKGKDNTGLSMLLSGLASALAGQSSETKHEKEQVKLAQAPEIRNEIEQPIESAMFDLIKHREPSKLVKKMIDTMREQLELTRVAYLYETGDETKPLHLVRGGLEHELSLPTCAEFQKFVTKLSSNEESSDLIQLQEDKISIEKRVNENRDTVETWPEELLRAGMKYMVSFPPAHDRAGLFTWGDSTSPLKTAQALRQLSRAGALLVDNAESFRRIEELSYTDNLTNLANRRYFLKRLREEIERAGRYERSLGLIIFDLDELKQINDRYGHLAGDSVIRRMGELLSSSIRNIDVIARYGGDEFCVIMPESDAATCNRFMERLVQKISSFRFELEHSREPLSLTASVGGALFPKHSEDSEGLIYAADMALLRAKEGGRNRSMLFK